VGDSTKLDGHHREVSIRVNTTSLNRPISDDDTVELIDLIPSSGDGPEATVMQQTRLIGS